MFNTIAFPFYSYAKCSLFIAMLSVPFFIAVLSVNMLSGVVPSVVMLIVIMPNVVMPSAGKANRKGSSVQLSFS